MSTEVQLAQPALTARPVRRSGAAIGRLTFLGMLLALCSGLFVLYAFYAGKGLGGSDWQTFYQAAERWRDGRQIFTVKDGFFSPPPFLLVVRAFLVLPYIPSRIVWGSLSALMLLLAARQTAQALCWQPAGSTRFLVAWWILCATPTVLLCPLTGNTSAVVVLAYALAFQFFGQRRDGAAGAVLALTLIKPQLAICTLPLLLYKRRWRAVGGYLAVVLAALAISLPVLGLQNYRDYLTVQRRISGWVFNNDPLQVDVPGIHGLFLQHWPHSHAADLAATAIGGLFVLALAWYWRGPWRPDSARFAAGWGLLIAVSLLIVSWAHSYDDVVLIVPALILYALAQRPGAPIARWVVPALIALYAAPVLVMLFHQHFMVPALLALCGLLTVLGGAGTITTAAQGHREK